MAKKRTRKAAKKRPAKKRAAKKRQALRKVIRNCPEPYLHPEGGHFLQEWGEDIAAKALAASA